MNLSYFPTVPTHYPGFGPHFSCNPSCGLPNPNSGLYDNRNWAIPHWYNPYFTPETYSGNRRDYVLPFEATTRNVVHVPPSSGHAHPTPGNGNLASSPISGDEVSGSKSNYNASNPNLSDKDAQNPPPSSTSTAENSNPAPKSKQKGSKPAGAKQGKKKGSKKKLPPANKKLSGSKTTKEPVGSPGTASHAPKSSNSGTPKDAKQPDTLESGLPGILKSRRKLKRCCGWTPERIASEFSKGDHDYIIVFNVWSPEEILSDTLLSQMSGDRSSFCIEFSWCLQQILSEYSDDSQCCGEFDSQDKRTLFAESYSFLKWLNAFITKSRTRCVPNPFSGIGKKQISVFVSVPKAAAEVFATTWEREIHEDITIATRFVVRGRLLTSQFSDCPLKGLAKPIPVPLQTIIARVEQASTKSTEANNEELSMSIVTSEIANKGSLVPKTMKFQVIDASQTSCQNSSKKGKLCNRLPPTGVQRSADDLQCSSYALSTLTNTAISSTILATCEKIRTKQVQQLAEPSTQEVSRVPDHSLMISPEAVERFLQLTKKTAHFTGESTHFSPERDGENDKVWSYMESACGREMGTRHGRGILSGFLVLLRDHYIAFKSLDALPRDSPALHRTLWIQVDSLKPLSNTDLMTFSDLRARLDDMTVYTVFPIYVAQQRLSGRSLRSFWGNATSLEPLAHSLDTILHKLDEENDSSNAEEESDEESSSESDDDTKSTSDSDTSAIPEGRDEVENGVDTQSTVLPISTADRSKKGRSKTNEKQRGSSKSLLLELDNGADQGQQGDSLRHRPHQRLRRGVSPVDTRSVGSAGATPRAAQRRSQPARQSKKHINYEDDADLEIISDTSPGRNEDSSPPQRGLLATVRAVLRQ